jgi:hypothetical protein
MKSKDKLKTRHKEKKRRRRGDLTWFVGGGFSAQYEPQLLQIL